jgi:Holliday junction DNA helicase RuvA
VIHHVEGVLAEKVPGRLVVETGGVGFEMLVSDATWRDVGRPGQPARLLTHLAVREDAWTLFGFSRAEERDVFRLLLGIQGVGPRMALAILSGVRAGALRRAVQEGDVEALTVVSGVGKKTAQRIIVDLRDRVGELPGGADGRMDDGAAAADADEAVDALVALGYSRSLAREAVRGARAEDPGGAESLEVVVKQALRRI